jgi:hypothetical protein
MEDDLNPKQMEDDQNMEDNIKKIVEEKLFFF